MIRRIYGEEALHPDAQSPPPPAPGSSFSTEPRDRGYAAASKETPFRLLGKRSSGTQDFPSTLNTM